ncbi:MAG: hypothetical protein H7281_03035 [Bacteriovorax sp.]|nr:hypothetical protein [Bacteriovorax sp.]
MRNFISLFLLLVTSVSLISSCANLNNSNMQSRTVEDYYVTTGVEKYFLTDIPSWANFDQKASCYRTTTIRYFDIEALMKSYGLSYNQSLQVQSTFNEEFTQFKKSDKKHLTTLKEEELLFYKVSEKVSSKIIFFDPPTYKRVNLIWLDEVLGDPKKENKLKNFLNSSSMDLGVPVLVSFCLTRDEVETQFPDFSPKMITAELFSVYDSKGIRTPGFKIDLGQFFKPDQKLYFYSQKDVVPTDEVKGTYKLLNY